MKAILTYHSLDPSGSPISVGEAAFRAHVRWLTAGKVRVVGLPELLELPEEEDAVALTFDDAFASFASTAWPLLRERGLPVTLFVPTAYVGTENGWENPQARGHRVNAIPVLPLCSWDTLGRLAEEGVTLGSHTRTHPDLRRLEAAALREEMVGAAERLRSETGHAPAAFAYPYGLLNEAVVADAARVYRYACTTELSLLGLHEDPLRLPRLDAYYLRDGRWLGSWGTPELEWRIRLRGRARRVRSLLAGMGALP